MVSGVVGVFFCGFVAVWFCCFNVLSSCHGVALWFHCCCVCWFAVGLVCCCAILLFCYRCLLLLWLFGCVAWRCCVVLCFLVGLWPRGFVVSSFWCFVLFLSGVLHPFEAELRVLADCRTCAGSEDLHGGRLTESNSNISRAASSTYSKLLSCRGRGPSK